MKRERVTQGQLRSAMRQQSSRLLDQVAAVAVETEGSLDVIRASVDGPRTARTPVRGAYAGAWRRLMLWTDLC